MSISYTVIVIKNDAIRRGIVTQVLNEVGNVLEIVGSKSITLTKHMVRKLKEYEWTNNWKPPPSDLIRQLSYIYEAQEVIALLCKHNGEKDAIEIGTILKGEHPLAHRCSAFTVRGKYHDPSIVSRIRTDSHGIHVLVDENGQPICYPPNVLHAVANHEELVTHVAMLFPELCLNLFQTKLPPKKGDPAP